MLTDPSRELVASNAPCRNSEHHALGVVDRGGELLSVEYANRPRGMGGKAAPTGADGPPAIVATPSLAPTEAARRWAALLQQLFEVDPLASPSCHGAKRIVACITQTSVIDQILTHLRTRAARAAHAGPRSPHRRGRPRAGARHEPHARAPTLRL